MWLIIFPILSALVKAVIDGTTEVINFFTELASGEEE